MKRRILVTLLLSGIAALVLATVTAATGGGTPTTRAELTIRHAAVGCHIWALNDGRFAKTQLLVLREGQSFTVENRDNCGHRLVQTGGPTAVTTENLSGAEGTVIAPLRPGVRVTLWTPGTYRFKTVEDEALRYGVDSELYTGFARQTSRGPDNTLQLIVRVWPDRNHLPD